MMDRRNSTDVELGFSDGAAVCGKQSESHEQIKIGMVLDKRSGTVVYPAQLELLVIGRSLSKETADELSIEHLLEGAQSRMRRQVAEATSLLGATEWLQTASKSWCSKELVPLRLRFAPNTVSVADTLQYSTSII